MKKILGSAILVMFLSVNIIMMNVAYAKGCNCLCAKIKKAATHIKKGIKKAGASVNNKVKDSYVSAKKKITGKKDKTWVKGHYKKINGKEVYVKGHWRKLKKSGGNSPAQ